MEWKPAWYILAGAVFLCGCSGSSPRFRSIDTSGLKSAQDEDEARFAPTIREELAREDDRKVDVQGVKKRMTSDEHPSPAGVNRDKFLIEVVSYLGTPYQYGGMSKAGMDCSALSSLVYAHAIGKGLPRSTLEQYEVGKGVKKYDLQFGDLVFFNTTGKIPSHVGIYIEDDLFAHASVVNGVTISSLESSYYKKRYVGARRIVE